MSTTPGEPGDIPALPEKRKRNGTALIAVAAVVVIVGAVVLIVNLTRSSNSADRVTVKIGTTEASADYWPILIKLAAAQGIDIQTVNFGDYTQANPALSQGQLDLNCGADLCRIRQARGGCITLAPKKCDARSRDFRGITRVRASSRVAFDLSC